MKVAVYYNNKDVRIQEMEIPKIGKDELLVKVKKSGICGSDVMEWYRIKKSPLVLGHEIVGEVAEVGKEVKNFKIRQRVFVSHHVPCNNCKYCKNGFHSVCETLRKTNYFPGGFSEYIKIPKINVENGTYLLPKEISDEEGVLIEPLACVIRGQGKLKIKNNSVLIIGTGVAGILHIQLAKLNKAKKVFAIDINNYKLNFAKKFGADAVFNATQDLLMEVKKHNENILVENVIVCTSSENAILQSLNCVDKAGTILFFAPSQPNFKVPLPLTKFWKDEITITTSYAVSPSNIENAIELIKNKKVNVKDMITHRLKFEEIQIAFNLVANSSECMKVILDME